MNCASSQPVTIVGGGLSGCIVALTAISRGMEVRLIDQGNRTAASRAAAGVINPITGMRFSRSWRIDEFLPVAIDFYQQLEEIAAKALWYPQPICRLFRSPELRDGFFKRRSLEELAPYAVRMVEPGEAVGPVENLYGGVWIEGGGWVDLAAFLDVARQRIEQEGEWIMAEGKITELCEHGKGIVVDCRGFRPDAEIWPHLDWKAAHGDILTFKADVKLPPYILNRAQFVLPLGLGHFRFGATYDWELENPAPSKRGRSALMDSFAEWVKLTDAEVIEQQAGIRPILRDQKPALGRHPELLNLAIFNGMGSKGGLWAPLLAETLLDYLLLNKELDPQIDVSRFVPA
ncbi:MAG: FAD-dependent oxidoreductase [Verrucomicrobiota bacterium]